MFVSRECLNASQPGGVFVRGKLGLVLVVKTHLPPSENSFALRYCWYLTQLVEKNKPLLRVLIKHKTARAPHRRTRERGGVSSSSPPPFGLNLRVTHNGSIFRSKPTTAAVCGGGSSSESGRLFSHKHKLE